MGKRQNNFKIMGMYFFLFEEFNENELSDTLKLLLCTKRLQCEKYFPLMLQVEPVAYTTRPLPFFILAAARFIKK
jgi:hypothetical protein